MQIINSVHFSSFKNRYHHNIYAPVDVEIGEITSHAITLDFDISVQTANLERIELQFVESNAHRHTVQIYPDGKKVCSCDQYFNRQCGCCKHLAVLKFMGTNGSPKAYSEFVKSLKALTRSVKPSVVNSYLVYDSLENETVQIGTGPNQIRSVSERTRIQLTPKSLQNQPQPIIVPALFPLVSGIALYDYQVEILQKMLNARRAICSMVLGSGKTISAVAGIKLLHTDNVLVICPKSVMGQWVKEFQRVLGKPSIILNKTNIHNFVNQPPVIGICTYQTFMRNVASLSKKKYDVVIADEIQYIRNNESKTWIAFKKIQSEYFWGLSGTVIENRLDDLYNIMDVVEPGLFGAKWKFDEKFKVLKSIHQTKVLYENELQNLPELKKLMSNRVFGYDKLTLPRINIATHLVELDKEATAEHASFMSQANRLISKSLSQPLSFGEKAILQSLLLKARQCCNTLELIDGAFRNTKKLQKILELIQTICGSKKQKLVIYSEWTTMLDIVEKIVPKHIGHVRFDGSMTTKKRTSAIEKFQTDPNYMIFFSSDAGSVGVDGLQLVCNHMIHTELPWNPAKLDQRIGRLHRLMQTKEVNVHYVVSTKSIEEKIQELLESKRQIRHDTLATE